jgi:hypothetical protein
VIRKLRARYDVVKVEHDRVFIKDLNDGGKTITNDAEAVVQEVHEEYPGRRIIYRDSLGQWDELCHHDGCFYAFLHYDEARPSA